MARFVSSPETFIVEEIPAYLPVGDGEHTYLWIEKRNLTTLEAVGKLARVLGVEARDIGYAGMKDRRATTRQWLSLSGVDPARAQEATVEGVRILATGRHRNKLRVGHLHGNRFEILLTDLANNEGAAISGALADLSAKGVPNRYGHQRFGSAGDNVEVGLAVCAAPGANPTTAGASSCSRPCSPRCSIAFSICGPKMEVCCSCAAATSWKKSPRAGSSPRPTSPQIKRAWTRAKWFPRRPCPAAACARPNLAAPRARLRIARWPSWALGRTNSARSGARCPERVGRWW
jgi:hypothetical protein